MQKTETKNSHVETPSLLTANKARESLRNLDGWQSTDDHKMIYREFILHDFMAAIDLIDKIAIIAEGQKHHPDIHLTQYRNLRVGLTTHDVGGLSDKDFAVASKIDEVYLNKKPQQSQNNKTKGIKPKRILNRMNQRIKKT